MKTTDQQTHPLAKRIKRLFALLLLAAWLAPFAWTTPAHAISFEAAAEPVEIAQNSTEELRTALNDVESRMLRIPFFGDKVMRPLIDGLKTVSIKNSKKFGDYLEATVGSFAATFFNIGTYNNMPRYVVGLSYDGTLGPPNEGIWNYMPTIDLIKPVIFFRFSGVATPIVKGSDLKNLPGLLAKRTINATAVTRTLRIPAGALLVAGLKANGTLETILDLFNYPTKNVFIMAGAGIDSYPPGGQKIGKNNVVVDPTLKSWGKGFAGGKGYGDKDVKSFRKAMPSASGYIKLSFKGKWYNPMYMFQNDTYAEDSVFMINKSGDVASWGTVREVYGNDYVYAMEIPAGFKGELPKLTFGLSADEMTLNDALKLQVGMMSKVADPPFLKIMKKIGKKSGTSDGAALSSALGSHSNNVQKVVRSINTAINKLPLDRIKINNPKFVDYDPVTESYPNVETFNLFFSLSEGILPDGSFGPKFISNGEMKLFGEKFGSVETEISLATGIDTFTELGADIHLGTVLGSSFDVKGKQSYKFVANLSNGVSMKQTQDWNILGIAKGKASMEYSYGKSGAKMRVIYDPTGGCAPPMPLKLDLEVDMPTSSNGYKTLMSNLLNSVKFDSGGIAKCAGKIYEWTKDGAKYIGRGTVIAGKYIAEGAKEVAGAAEDGAKYTAKYSKEGAKYVKNFSANANAKVGGGVVKGGKAVFNFAKNLGRSINKLGKSMGCSTGLNKCSSPKPKRIASPFICGPGFHYSREYGRCWSDGAVMLAFTGAKTKQRLCLDATSGGVGAPMALRPCDGSLNQQFRTGNTGDQPTMSFQRNMIGNRDNVGGLEGKGKFRKGQSIISLALASPRPHNIFLDKQGRLYSRAGGRKFCVRPNNTAVRPNRYGRMAGWAKTPGDALDIGVSADGRAFKVGGDGKPYAFAPSDHKWHVISDSNLRRMDAGPAATLWATQNNNSIHRYANGAWQKMPGAATDIGVGGPNGNTVVAVSTTQENKPYGYMTYKWDATKSNWVSLNGHGYRVDVDGAGTAWLTQRNGSVWRKNTKAPAKGKWTKLPKVPGGALDISAGHSGGVMVSTKKGEIYALNGKKWIKFPGSAVSLSLGPKGSPWVAAKIDATVYAYKTATSVKGWPGLPQPSPLDVVDLDNATLAYDDCEEKPVMATWTRVYPKTDAPWAAKAGLNYSFVISQNSHVLDNFGASRAGAFIKGGRHDARWPGNQEFSAVYVKETWFALYHHQTGLCLGDGRSDGRDRGKITQDYYDAPNNITENDQALKLWPCRFNGNQLWWRQPIRTSGYRLHNINTKRCMASIGRDGQALRQKELVQMFTEKRCKDMNQLGHRAVWGMDKAGTKIINRAGEKATTSPYLSAEFFDPSFYLMKFPDLKNSLGNNIKKLEKHWLDYGVKEGRDGSWAFSVKSYVNRYPDLKKFAANYAAAFDHWRMNGKKEGRNPRPNCGKTGIIEFDPGWYLNNDPNLKKTLGNDQKRAYDHWNQYGKKEGRNTSATFSIKSYVNRYPDLKKAFRTNWAAAWKHWDKDGKKECRNPRP